MAKSDITVKLNLQTSEFSKGLAAARKDVKSFSYQLGNAIGKAPKAAFLALGAASTALAAALGRGLPNAYKTASALNDMSDKTGIAAGQMRVLQQAAKDNGIEDIVGPVTKLQMALAGLAKNNSGPAAEALTLLGLSAEKLRKESPVDQIDDIGKAMNRLNQPNLNGTITKALFGKGGIDMMPLFKDPEAMAKARQSVGGLSGLYDKNAAGMDETSRKIESIPNKSEQLFGGIAAGAKPGVDKVLDLLGEKDFTSLGKKWGEEWADGFDLITKGKIGTIIGNIGLKIIGSAQTLGDKWEKAVTGHVHVDHSMDDLDKRRNAEAAERERMRHKWDMTTSGGRLGSSGGLSGGTNAIGSSAFYDLFHGGGEKQHLMNGGFGGQISSLNRGAYGQKSLLSKKERDASMDAMVSAGTAERPHGAIKRGDKKRRQEYQRGELRKEASLTDVVGQLKGINKALGGTPQ